MDQREVPQLRLKVLSFSTSDLFRKALEQELASRNASAAVSTPGNTLVIPDLTGGEEAPETVTLILLDAGGFYDRDWRLASEAAAELLSTRIGALKDALEAYVGASRTPIVVNTLPATGSVQAGFIDAIHADGAAFLAEQANGMLRTLAGRHSRLRLVDAETAMASIAPNARVDAKLWFYGRLPYSGPATQALATAFCNVILPRRGPTKVVALDLDDTLWRGIFGEVGIKGLECGDDFPGNAFRALQAECLRLKSHGLILTILSKNDEGVLEVLDQHPGMLLKREDFVSHRINWSHKADNIRELASELSLGLDSFLLLDDSPHEREAMRQLAPEVYVPELPADPALRPQFVRSLVCLWPQQLTAEDRERTALYSLQGRARTLRSEAGGADQYLASLEQCLATSEASAVSLPRIAQMHARTNQFNMTTLRLGESELAACYADRNGYLILQGSVRDKFGDHGVVICAVARVSSRQALIESFLMSCRVIGRDVEIAFVAELLKTLVARGVEQVEGRFVPTERNDPARDLYERAGFRPLAGADGVQLWQWNAGAQPFPTSQFVAVTAAPSTCVA